MSVIVRMIAAVVVTAGCAKEQAGQSDSASLGAASAGEASDTTQLGVSLSHSMGDTTARPDTMRKDAAARRNSVAVSKRAQPRPKPTADATRRISAGRSDSGASATVDGATNSVPPKAAAAERLVKVNEFLSYDAAAKTAHLTLIGGYNNTNSSLNFNGGANGNQTVVIPIGWRVQASFVNRDGDLPHSAIVINDVSPIPNDPPPAAFRAAFTVKLIEGLQDGGSDDMSFTANKEGNFLIFCGVPGHGVGGMYIKMTVSSRASVPAYEQ